MLITRNAPTRHWGPSTRLGKVELSIEQPQRVHPDRRRDALHRAKSQIPLATLDTTHVGAMNADQIGQRLLTETEPLTMLPEIAAEPTLKLPFHTPRVS